MTRVRHNLPPAVTSQHAIGGRQCDGSSDFGLKGFMDRADRKNAAFHGACKPGLEKLLFLLNSQRLPAASAMGMGATFARLFATCGPRGCVMASDGRSADSEDAGNGGRGDGDCSRQQDAQRSESLKAEGLIDEQLAGMSDLGIAKFERA